MLDPETHELTRLLHSVSFEDTHAAERLLPLVYEDLRRLAAAKMRSEPAGQTLQATALVHEAWLRVAGEHHDWRDRRHFFTIAAEVLGISAKTAQRHWNYARAWLYDRLKKRA